MERFPTTCAGPRQGPFSPAEVMEHGLFRMSPGEVPALRRRPGAIPDGWGAVAPSLLRYSDEQTVAGTAAVFAAIARGGLRAGRVRGLGRGSRVAISRAGEPGPGPAELPGGGRVGHLAALDPALCPPFPGGHDQPGARAAWTERRGRRRALRRRRRVPGCLDLAIDWRRPGRLAGAERLVARARSGTAREWSRSRRMPGPGPRAVGRRRWRAAPGCSGPWSGLRQATRPLRLDLVKLAEWLESPGERSPRTIATDPRGRVRIELVETSAGLE